MLPHGDNGPPHDEAEGRDRARSHGDQARRPCRIPSDPPRARQPTGGAAPSSTRSTRGASRTATATASATSRASARRLPYLADLGVDAIWFTPWYRSPIADGGYDVADYRAIDPVVRHARGGGAAHRRGRGARHPDHRRRRPQPRLRPARVVPGGPRLACPARRSATGSGSARARASTATRCRRPGGRRSRARRGRARPTPTARPASGTSTCSPPPSRT